MSEHPVLKPLVYCASCTVEQSLTSFRKLSEDPLTYVDFCGTCEKQFGTLSLYNKYGGTPAVTRRARDIVVSGKDLLAPTLETKAVNYREEQTREFARRELSRKYFLYYVKQFNPTYLAGWVHKDIARRLEQFIREIEEGKSPRLMLCMPPRHGKSTLASIEFPSWVLGQHPEWEIISASYASSLPIGFSRTIKDRLDDPDYHAIFPGTKLRSDARGVEEWYTTKKGRYRAAGVEGGITGTGANCVVPYCAINTPYGAVPAATVKVGSEIYGYDHTTGCVARTRVVAICISRRNKRILDVSGAVLTTDHPVYTSEGYQPAEFTEGMSGLRLAEDATCAYVHALSQSRISEDQHSANLRLLREAFYTHPGRNKQGNHTKQRQAHVLLHRLLQGVQEIASAAVQYFPRRLYRLWNTAIRQRTQEVLLASVLPGAPSEEPRNYKLWRSVAGDEVPYFTVISGMRTLRRPPRTDGSAPRGSRCDEQRVVESGADLCGLSQTVSRTAGCTAADLARLHAIDDYLVDFQTETTNFFAAKSLIHNCLLIDDPIKDYQEAQSPKVRENAYNWYTSTARTRLAPGGGVLMIATRWHDGDLLGAMLSDRQALLEANVPLNEIDDWKVVSYPAIAEYDEYLFPDRTIQVAPDQVPEGAIKLRGKEEALHPERYSALELRRIRNTMPSVQWNALYQQNPVPETGEYFTKDMFRGYSTLPGAEDDYAYFSAWDLAIGEKAQNDWTVGTICAYHYTGAIYVLDMIRGRMNMHGIISSMIAMARKWPHMQVLGIEQGQIYKTMAPLLNEAMLHHKVRFALTEELKPVTDKLMRGRPLQQKMQMGLVHFPTAQPWVALVERELLRFPSGTHDDIVDSLAWLIRMSMVISPPKPQSARALNRRPESWKKQLKVTSGDKSFMTA